MMNTALGTVIFPGKRQGMDKGKIHRYFCNVLALKLGGRFISDQFIIKLHKGHIFLHICWKIYIIKIKGTKLIVTSPNLQTRGL